MRLAALYDPVITSAIGTPLDVALALGASCALMFWSAQPWLVEILMALAGWHLGL